MKIVIYLKVICLCASIFCNCYAQQVYFDKQYQSNLYIGFASLIDDTSYIYSLGYKTNNLNLQEVSIAKTSYTGDTILNKSLLKNDTIYYYVNATNIFCKLNNKFYFATGAQYQNTIINNEKKDVALLLKFDENGDTIFSKTYLRYNSFRMGFQSIIVKKSNNSLISLGYTIKLDSLNQRQVKIYIANLDTLGNIIWEHEYGYSNQIAVTPQIIPASDGGYYIPGSIDDAADGIQFDYYLLKIDSIGNQIYQRQWGLPELQEGISGFKELPNQQLYLTGSTTNVDFFYRRPFIGKMDENGIMGVQNFYFQSNANIGFTKIFNHQEHFLTLVYYKEDGGYKKVAFLEFNSNLDSLNTTFFDFNGNQQLYDFIQLPDKGYLLGGFFKSPGQTPFYNAWLMRIDSNLCANTACIPVGIEELYQTFGQKTKVNVFPNPATNILNIEILSNNINASFEFVEITGKLLKKGNFNSTLNTIDLNQYSNGIYFLKTNFSAQKSTINKIIISK